MSLDGKWKTMNPASKPIFGYDPKDMTGESINGLFYDSEEKDIELTPFSLHSR